MFIKFTVKHFLTLKPDCFWIFRSRDWIWPKQKGCQILCKNCFLGKLVVTCLSTLCLLRTFQSGQLICGMQGEKELWLKSRRSMVACDSQIKIYVQNIHNMPKIFWGAWPLTILERPNCSKVLVPLSKLSVSKNVWFTNARLGPLDFIHSEMLKMGMGGSGPSGKQPLGSTISGAGPPLGATHGDFRRFSYV